MLSPLTVTEEREVIVVPFPDPPAVPDTTVAKGKAPENVRTDALAPYRRVGGVSGTPLATVVCHRGGVLGSDRPPGRVPHTTNGPPSPPRVFPGLVSDSQRAHSLLTEIDTMMEKGVLEIVPDPGPGFYSRLFLVEKASGGWRPVIDLSPLNEFIQQTPFRMETPSSVLLAVRENDFLASIDLKDAYFQVPVHPASRKLLRFVSSGKVYQFKALCFGLSTAPQVFTRVFAAVSSWAHALGIRLLRYLDDWLILSPSEKQTQQHINQLLSLCRSLGIVVNTEKSDLSPSKSVEYLGMIIDTMFARAFPTEARIQKFLFLSRKFLAHPSPLARQWQVLLGHMSSLEKLVPRARLRTRSLQWQLKSNWSIETDSPHLPISQSQQVDTDIAWWMSRDHLFQGAPFGATPPPQNSACTRTHLGRGGELTSLISQHRDYGRSRRPPSI